MLFAMLMWYLGMISTGQGSLLGCLVKCYPLLIRRVCVCVCVCMCVCVRACVCVCVVHGVCMGMYSIEWYVWSQQHEA